MAERAVVVRLRAEIADFRRQMDQAAKSTEGVGDKARQSSDKATTGLGQMVQSANQHKAAWDQAGASLTGVGLAAVAGLGLATRSAMEWESAWTGVLKTVDGTDAQMATLEGNLRNLAKTLPATHSEIAAVAEAAGQLGVQAGAITAFTRTMVDLGETTNLTADEAATSIAQMANVMGTDLRTEVGNFGASLVALGNAGASTEADILAMATRLSGAGKLIGASESDVLGLANAMASMGIEAQLGGGVMSRVLQKIYSAVQGGAEELTGFAQVAGVSAADFAAAFESDPVRATDAFIQGLNRIEESGGNVVGALDDLGIKGTEDLSVLLRLKGAGDLLAESLDLGAKAWKDNTALLVEAGKRYDTTEAKLQVARNGMNDAAITIGETFLPVLADAAGGVANLAEWIGGLPEPVLNASAGLGAVAGTAALVGGGFLLLVPRVVDTIGAFRTLRTDMPKLADGMGRVGKAAGIATAALAATAAAGALFGGEASGRSVSQFTDELLKLGDATDSIDLQGVRSTFDLAEGMERLTNPTAMQRLDDLAGKVTSFFGARSDAQLLAEEFEGVGQALASMYSVNPDIAASKFADVLDRTGVSTDELLDKMPAYRDALLDAENQQQTAADGAAGLSDGLDVAADAATAAAAEMSDFAKSLMDLGGAFADPLSIYQEQMQALAQASADAANAAETDTEAASLSWQDFTDDVTVSLGALAAELEAQTTAQETWRDNLVTIAQRGGNEVASILAGMGAEGARLTDEMANATGEDFERMKNALIEDARLGGEGAARELEKQMAVMAQVGATGGDTTAKAIAEKLGLGVGEVAEIAREYGIELASGVNPLLNALGKPRIAMGMGGAGGTTAYAQGGIEDHYAQIAPAGANRLWAEPETGGEAYIPLAPSKRDRSLGIWRETGKRLGAAWEEFANGGFSSGSDVPKPSSTAPYRSPISPPGDAAMEEGYSEALAFIKENSLAGAGGDLVGLGRKLQQMGFRVGEHPAFGGVNGGHMPGSYHYQGRAIDVNYGPGGQSAGETAAINALLPQLAGLKFAEKLWQVPGHYDHLHLAMAKGGVLNPHVRDNGGPLLPGYTFNGTGGPETVVRGQAAVAAPAMAFPDELHLTGSLVIDGLPAQIDAIAHTKAVEAIRLSRRGRPA